ncbi:MAG: tetratricopeptide repeat protein [Acidimicrobiia bacterium]|nr:tetratricopeptide repeat protein [Acidimicrobiia bacterium]
MEGNEVTARGSDSNRGSGKGRPTSSSGKGRPASRVNPRSAPRKPEVPIEPAKPAPLRIRGKRRPVGESKPEPKRRRTSRNPAAKPVSPRYRKRGPKDVRDEILRVGGKRGERLHAELLRAADAVAADRERDAVRILSPLRDELPDSPSIRELLGVSLYRTGKWAAATKELEQYVVLTGSVDQHPILMDCARARKDYERVNELWRDLADVSPSPGVVAEGRIVLAGSLADQGKLEEAVKLLDRRADGIKNAQEHHLRLWYALADLEERSGNIPRARALFTRIRQRDASFADVAERLSTLV